MKKPNFVEDHFDRIISQKEQIKYQFDPYKMGAKDRKIIQSLTYFGISGKKCLDIGPGTGRWLSFLRQQGASYLAAIDITGPSLKRCSPFCSRMQKADLETEEFSFDSDFFDIIISFEVIEHIRNPEKYLSEIYRVANNNCLILISLPNITSFISRVRMLLGELPVAVCDPTHVRFYRKKDINKLFKRFNMLPEFIPTSISMNPLTPKSRFRIPSNRIISTLDDSILIKAHIEKQT